VTNKQKSTRTRVVTARPIRTLSVQENDGKSVLKGNKKTVRALSANERPDKMRKEEVKVEKQCQDVQNSEGQGECMAKAN